MVQKAISDDILRYQKTLLVWTESIERDSLSAMGSQEEVNKKKYEINQKLELVQKALIEILIANKDGVSLAQLPNHLKNKLKFQYVLSEFGFSKLKDLILSMSDRIKIENRGHNHPFAVLINPEPYIRSANSSEDFSNVPSYYKAAYSHYGNDYDYYKHNMQYAMPPSPTPYYPHMMPGYMQKTEGTLRRNESASSFQSSGQNKNWDNLNAMGNDSVYVPQATSLYGSVSQGGFQHHLNISHCRNNTGSDIGYDNTLPLTAKHKQNNFSHDYTLGLGMPSKVWLKPQRQGFGMNDDLLEINSSNLFSEENSMFDSASRAESPNHTRTVSNLNDPSCPSEFPNFRDNSKMPTIINRISEEHKSEERKSDEDNNRDYDEFEDLIAPILSEAVQPPKVGVTKSNPSNKNTSKLIPTSKIFLPSNRLSDKSAEVILNKDLVSASKLRAKTDNVQK